MMTVDSTMIPKSTAPSEIRLAGVPPIAMPSSAANRASGMLSAESSAARQFPRKRRSTADTSTIPRTRLWRTVCVVVWIRCVRS